MPVIPYRKRMRAVGAHVTNELYDRFAEIAAEDGMKPGALASVLIEDYVEQREQARRKSA